MQSEHAEEDEVCPVLLVFECLPVAHRVQVDLPCFSWYWPCGQGSHVTFPIAAANLPAEQGAQIKSVSPFECVPF